jgi:hypothetical protein
MTESGFSRLAMYRNELASAVGTTDLPDWHVLKQWLAGGADFWRDVLPTVRIVIAARRATEPGWRPSSLKCFTQAIERALIVRVMGPQPNARELGPTVEAEPRRKVGIDRKPDRRRKTRANIDSDAAERALVIRAMRGVTMTSAHVSARDRNPPNDRPCLWCRRRFKPRRDGGTAQRFCAKTCRRAFDRASRAWVRQEVGAGRLSVTDLMNGPSSARALVPGASGPPGMAR